jgi:hypothetical protein
MNQKMFTHIAIDPLGNMKIDADSPLPGELTRLAEYLNTQFRKAAGYVTRVEGDGWRCDAVDDEIWCTHPDVTTRQAARQRLESVQIDPNDVKIWQWPEDDDAPKSPTNVRSVITGPGSSSKQHTGLVGGKMFERP